MKQTKEEFLKNVRYHAGNEGEYRHWLKETDKNHRVDLDPELSALFDDCSRYENLMLETAIKLSIRCQEKLEGK